MRIAIGLEYDGSQYHGWQRQPGLHTVQGEVEKALSIVADQEVAVHCAGRTDTGVHASAQVIHIDSTAPRTTRNWIYGGNNYLPKDISIRWAKEVSEEFHARFSATARRYRYVIYNHHIRPGLLRSSLTWHNRPLDISLMQTAANYLIGEHDFTSYRALGCQSKTPMRNMMRFEVIRQGDLVILDITANAFLHHMIRNIAGVLLAIGTANQNPIWAKEILEARDRRQAGVTAPPYGLYLVQITYPDHFGLPRDSLGPAFLSPVQTSYNEGISA